LGGVRSGKSAFAEGLVEESGGPLLYLATGVPTDPEMEERINRHRMARPAHWTTIEEPLDLAGGLEATTGWGEPPAGILIDSLDVWVANQLMEQNDSTFHSVESFVLGSMEKLLQVIRQASGEFVLVSSEVGLSLVPPEPLGRRFQDLLGTVNQRAAAAADRVYLVVVGIPTQIKGLS
jgi:adenosylcobinamide kinase/adenosylcobinamide-phosphate guanylyltransferase